MIDIYRRWIPRAACSGHPTSLFFPEVSVPGGREAPKKQDWAKAKRICNRCPVQAQCRRDHLGERYGVWGGLDPEQRRDLLTKRSANVENLPREDKIWLARFIGRMRAKNAPPTDIQRLLALNARAIDHLEKWWAKEQNPTSVVYLPGTAPRKAGMKVTEEERRKVLNLARLGVMTYREIADHVGRTPNTVGQIIRQSKENRGTKASTSEVGSGGSSTDQADHTPELFHAG